MVRPLRRPKRVDGRSVANDHRTPARRSIVDVMRNDAPILALVPADSIYGSSPPAIPTWPFIKYGMATILPMRGSCLDGSRIIVSIHAFDKGPSEDGATEIAKAIAKRLDGAEITLETGETMTVTWTGGQTLRDTDEASAWHCPVDLELEISAG